MWDKFKYLLHSKINYDTIIKMSETPNPTFSIIFFVIITTIYSIIKYNLKSNTSQTIYFGIYICVLLIGQFFINLNLSNVLCGENQWGTTLMITAIPWVFIFVMISYLLTLFPGWLAPFSNTFGYGVALLAGIGSLMNNILQPNPKLVPNNQQTKIIQESLAHIYADKSLLINEITLENFNYFWQKMSGIFKEGVKDNTQLKLQLYNMVKLKTLVAEYIWYILTGLLVTSVSYNYLINSGCSRSTDEMTKRHDEYLKNLSEKQSDDDKRVYSTTD